MDSKIKEIAEYIKTKTVFLAADFTGGDSYRKDGIFILESGKKIPGYIVHDEKSGRILIWEIPKSKDDAISVLSQELWEPLDDAPYDYAYASPDSNPKGSHYYYENGESLDEYVEDFESETNEMYNLGFSAYFSP